MDSSLALPDRLRRLLQPLRLFWGLERGRARGTDATDQPDPPIRLDRILILLARRPGRREELQLMTGLMSLREIHFQTREKLEEGQGLHLQVLLEPGVALRVEGLVVECRQVDGEYRGRLDLSCGSGERASLSAYLAKRSARPFP